MGSYAEDHMIPYLLQYGDADVACGTGVAMGAFLNSFERVTAPPHRAAVPTLLSAAVCAQQRAWEAELLRLRSLFRGNTTEALDARIVEQRNHVIAARRLNEAHERTQAAFPKKGASCPVLENDYDKMVWLLGALSAIQGVQHDRAAAGAVGIPLDVPVQAARATACLNNKEWWGVPLAIRAAIWATVPGTGPPSADPWAMLQESLDIADAAKVRLAYTVLIQTAEANGRKDLMEETVRRMASKLAAHPAAVKWRTFDQIALLQARFVSDKAWTVATGSRTPFGEFGSLPQKVKKSPDTKASDELLDGL
ncbi:MAG: hypothetical protein ACON3Z_02620 [Bradymonadia bacterium]